MPEVSDDEDQGHSDAGDTPSPEEGTDDQTPESYDEYVTAQVLLPLDCEAKKAIVVGRKCDHDGWPIGKQHANPLLNKRLCEVEFPAANLIAENMLSQVDDKGRSYSVLSEIVDYRTNDHNILNYNGFVEDRCGKRHPQITTQGWDLQVEWRDGSMTWVALSDLKASNPIEVAEYAVTNKMAKEPGICLVDTQGSTQTGLDH